MTTTRRTAATQPQAGACTAADRTVELASPRAGGDWRCTGGGRCRTQKAKWSEWEISWGTPWLRLGFWHCWQLCCLWATTSGTVPAQKKQPTVCWPSWRNRSQSHAPSIPVMQQNPQRTRRCLLAPLTATTILGISLFRPSGWHCPWCSSGAIRG